MKFEGIKRLAHNAHLFFIPEKYRVDEEVFRKCKVFINTTLITSLFALFFLGNAIMFRMPMATVAMVVCIAMFFSFAWFLRYGVPINVCTNLYIALGVGATAWDAYWAGGLNSIHTPWFVFPALGAILIGTIQQGRVWLIISLLVVLAFGAASIGGYKFPNELGDKYHDWMATSAYAGLIIILFVCVLVVENAYQNSLKRWEAALISLRKSQDQLVHQEKLASLGQLIAGIAHEIQNPLNFVNNFSSVSKDLLKDLQEAETPEEKAAIVKLLTENLERIEQHGKRADGIVKDMLMHSRTQPGEKQLSDVNRICDEAIILAYQSAKANIPGFDVKIDKQYSHQMAMAKVIPQEISRVVLNLLDNAIYSVNQKKKQKLAAQEIYQPEISLTTSAEKGNLFIRVKDNGLGISQPVLDHVFQPFFTTKPTKEGTGLGLSISFDIIKAHGGDLMAESREAQDAVFTVTLPL